MWAFDSIDKSSLDMIEKPKTVKFESLRNKFENALAPKDGNYLNINKDLDKNVSFWLGEDVSWNQGLKISDVFKRVKEMLNGTEINGTKTLGLLDISKMKVNPEYRYQNIKQQAGWCAEVISTTKDNLIAKFNGSELITRRTDDLPKRFGKNHQLWDKVRLDTNGSVVDRIQVKFVGKNASECLSKLLSKDYEKYFVEGALDHMEIPKDFFDEIIDGGLLQKKLDGFHKQLDKVIELGKTDEVSKIEAKIDRCHQLENKLLRSTVTQAEAIYAREHPKAYSAKLFVKNAFTGGHLEGLQDAKISCAITSIVSSVDNVSAFIDGKISASEMVTNIIKDTGTSGALAYGTGFISGSISGGMQNSSQTLIKQIGGTCVPGLIVSFAVDSYDSISDFMQGAIDGNELAYDLGKSASSVGGSFIGSVAGSALTGAAFGSVAGPLGTAIGVTGGLVGGVVGTVITSEMYVTALEAGVENTSLIKDKITEYASNTIEMASEFYTDSVDSIKNSFNQYFSEHDIDITF